MGRVVPQKQCDLSECGCVLRCSHQISEDRRKDIFKGFYNLDWDMKHSFLADQIEVTRIKRKYTKNENSRRDKTRIYRLRDEQGDDKIVCKKFFKGTLAVCDGTITNALKRKQVFGTPRGDLRGKHTPHNKTSLVDEQRVCDFIRQFPSYHSHYCRRDSNRKYLNPELNMKIMYNMYKSRCIANEEHTVSLFIFRQIFNTKFNLDFHHPQKDTCQTCDEFKVRPRLKSRVPKCSTTCIYDKWMPFGT